MLISSSGSIDSNMCSFLCQTQLMFHVLNVGSDIRTSDPIALRIGQSWTLDWHRVTRRWNASIGVRVGHEGLKTYRWQTEAWYRLLTGVEPRDV